MARKSIYQRNEKQRLRQQNIRQSAKDLKRPSRDDLARMLLWQMITLVQKADGTNKQQALDGLCNKIVSGLVKQGFNERQSEDVFDDLAKKYASSLPPFRVKRHLQNDTHTSE
jgi:hypothetical protein